MAAQLIDPTDNDDEVAHEDQVQTQQAPTPQHAAPMAEDEDIPEKYRGKSAAELIRIAREQESYIGRQGQELGTLRKLTDQALALGQGRSAPPAVETEDVLDANTLLDNPREAVSRVAKQSIRPIEERLERMELTEKQREFVKAHPAAMTDAASAEFQQWMQAKPSRTRLAQQALGTPERPDFDAADELFSLWEDYKEAQAVRSARREAPDEGAEQPQAPAKTKPKPELVTPGGGKGPEHGSDGTIYSRAKLTKMQMTDPDAYYDPAFQAKLHKAFLEKRVR